MLVKSLMQIKKTPPHLFVSANSHSLTCSPPPASSSGRRFFSLPSPRRFLHAFAAALSLGVFCAAPAWAETVTYDADATPPVTVPLQTFLMPTGANAQDLFNIVAPANSGDPTYKSTSLTGNTVTFISGTVDSVYGAANFVDSAAVTGNQVIVRGGTAGIIGVANAVNGGRAGNNVDANGATASGNSVTVTDGTFYGDILGGRVSYSLGNATANDNIVNVTGGHFNVGVAGARLESYAGTGTASNNTVNISGAPTFSPTTNIQGGTVTVGGAARVSANNTLNLHSSGVSIYALQYFQNLNFYLPKTLIMDGVNTPTMLAVDSVINTHELPSLACAKVSVFLDADTPATILRKGDVNLIKATTNIGSGSCYDLTVPAGAKIGGRPYTLVMNPSPFVGLAPGAVVLRLGENTEAGLASDPTPGGWQVTPVGGGSGLTKSPADLIKLSTTVPYSTTAATLADIMKIVSTDAVVTIYSDAGFTNNASATGIPLTVGSGNHVYIEVQSQDGTTTRYYDLIVIRSNPPSTAAVPTLSEWALMLLGLVMLGMAGLHVRRRG